MVGFAEDVVFRFLFCKLMNRLQDACERRTTIVTLSLQREPRIPMSLETEAILLHNDTHFTKERPGALDIRRLVNLLCFRRQF